jgi:tRNA (mo5U34)-methyltransferase
MMDDAGLTEAITSMRPWHHDIALNEQVSTGKVFSPDGSLERHENDGVSLISPRSRFMRQTGQLYPGGMSGKRFLDCACNAGAYCFFARELDAAYALGFDVRSHWINQALFVQQRRTIHSTDRIDFHEIDLMDLPDKKLEPFDFTYFKGIFYHLPDPVTGLKIATELTTDVILVNTAGLRVEGEPRGMTLALEGTEPPMSGVHRLSWMPNSPEVVVEILKWLGFEDFKLTHNVNTEDQRLRFEVIAGRTPGRLEHLDGECLA